MTTTMTIHPASTRGVSNFGWLDSRHSFSFGEFYDPNQMGYRALRVINDDRIDGGGGFPTHPHRDMEIISYVVEGSLSHKDSMGNGSVIRAGEVQYMGAGTGVRHSEFNPSQTEPMRLIQIWVLPEKSGLPPAYGQIPPPAADQKNAFRLLASRDGADGSLVVRQDMKLLSAKLDRGKSVAYDLKEGRHAWLQMVRGEITLAGQRLHEGDGVSIDEATALELHADADSEVLLFDLN